MTDLFHRVGFFVEDVRFIQEKRIVVKEQIKGVSQENAKEFMSVA